MYKGEIYVKKIKKFLFNFFHMDLDHEKLYW